MGRGRIPLEELVRLPGISLVSPSWNRDRIAFFWNKTGRNEIYSMNLRSRSIEQVTDGEAPNAPRAGYVWTRDDSAIIFGKDKDGDEQNNLFRLDLASRTVTQLNDDPRSQEYPGEVGPDGRSMLVTSNRNGQLNLFRFDLAEQTWQQLTHFKAPIGFGPRWSPDGQWVSVTSNESANLQNGDIYLVKADGSEIRKFLSVKDGSREGIDAFHPDGRLAAVTSDAGGSNRPGILDLQTGEVRWLGREGVEEYAGEFSRNGRWLSAIRNQDGAVMPLLYAVETGEERLLKLPPGFAIGVRFMLDDSHLLISYSAANRRSEVLLYNLAEDRYEVLLPAAYGSIDPALFLADEHIRYPSSDGAMVPAILIKPRDAASGERMPAVIDVHGGPTAQHLRTFDPYAQYLADQGYVVLKPNPRGSTGYGVPWRDAALKDWGGVDLEDIAAGAEYLKTLPFVDPDRIAVFGGSYGGYMSFMAVVKKPDLFKVGIPWVGITDLHRLYDESMEHFKYYLRQQMGDPEADRKLWRDRSAITHAEKLKAKLLILHGLNDPRCPISQARIFRDRLVDLGKREGSEPEADFEYHEFGDEGHGFGGNMEQQLRTYQLLVDFLHRRL